MTAQAQTRIVLFILLLGLAALPGQSRADARGAELADTSDFAKLSLEELANLQISSVTRKQESLASAAASVFVITADDIRRTGATSLPEALRLAPNLQVARISANSWAISARGFNSTTANKLLVLIDGRPVYTPLYSGVFWDQQDVFMPDIDRIEVIGGPNATTWGSNAVNGVINVVTRHAGATGGGLATASAGDQERAYGLRIGNRAEGDTRYRVYGQYFSADETEDEAGNIRNDAFDRAQAGFRLDVDQASDRFTLQGDVYRGTLEFAPDDMPDITGANLLARWQHSIGDTSSITLQGYYDRSGREFPDAFEESLDIVGVDFSHQFQPAEDQVLLWGVDVRYARDDITNNDQLAFFPARKNLSWTSLFVQDELRLAENLSVILGARVEDNDYTGVEFMPNARVSWTPVDAHTFWSSLSRAVRTPSRIDSEFFAPAQPPYLLAGGEGFKSEVANVIELGYRAQPVDDISWSLTAFYHDYDRLRSVEVDGAGTLTLQNKLRGDSSGLEGWISYHPLPSWRLSAGFFVLDKNLELQAGSTSNNPNEGNDPSAQWQLRSSWDISADSELEIFVRHVGKLPDPAIPDYTSVDLRLAWRALREFEIAVQLQNLLDDEHPEFGNPGNRSEFGRQVSLQLRWSYQ